MTFLDYFVLIVVAVSTASGATKGILKGIISVATAVAGLVSAAYLYRYAAVLLGGFVSSARSANLLGFVAIFLSVVIAGSFASRRFRARLRRARLGWVDHALGGGFGLARGWLVCSVIYLALTAFPVRLSAVERSLFAPVLLEGTRVISYLTSSELRERFLNGYAAVQRVWEEKG